MGNSLSAVRSSSPIIRPKSPIEEIRRGFVFDTFREHHEDLHHRTCFLDIQYQSKQVGDESVGISTLDDKVESTKLVYNYLDPFFRREIEKNEAKNETQTFKEVEILSQPSIVIAASENLEIFTCFEDEVALKTHIITVGRTAPDIDSRYQSNHVHVHAPDPNEIFSSMFPFALESEFDTFFNEVKAAEQRFNLGIPQIIASPRGKSGCWVFAFFLIWRLYTTHKIIIPIFEEKKFELPSYLIEVLTIFNFFHEKNIKFDIPQAWYSIFDACFVYKIKFL